MDLVRIVFEATCYLWIVFACAAPLTIWLAWTGGSRMARYLVGGEIALAALLVAGGVIAVAAMGPQAAGWDVIGILLWAAIAFLVAGVTGAIVLCLRFVQKRAAKTAEHI